MVKILVCIPTYNEIENIETILRRVLLTRTTILESKQEVEDLQILLIDDASPDGTSHFVKALQLPHLNILDRSAKAGLGPAYIAGFSWGSQRGFTHMVEMDADGSHQPEELPRLVRHIPEADLILGTRWMPGGRVLNWPFHRRILSLLGTQYASKALRLPFRDLTGGYRILSATLLDKVNLERVQSKGYGFQIEMVMRASAMGARIVEVPITFIDRTLGSSKMNGAIALEAIQQITVWALRGALEPLLRSSQPPK